MGGGFCLVCKTSAAVERARLIINRETDEEVLEAALVDLIKARKAVSASRVLRKQQVPALPHSSKGLVSLGDFAVPVKAKVDSHADDYVQGILLKRRLEAAKSEKEDLQRFIDKVRDESFRSEVVEGLKLAEGELKAAQRDVKSLQTELAKREKGSKEGFGLGRANRGAHAGMAATLSFPLRNN